MRELFDLTETRVLRNKPCCEIIPEFALHIQATGTDRGIAISVAPWNFKAPQDGNVMVENRCPPRPLLSSLLCFSRSCYPTSTVKLPSRYSSNFRSNEAVRNCNDVFGRLTYRLGNLFIRARRRHRKCMESSATYRHSARNGNFRRLHPRQ